MLPEIEFKHVGSKGDELFFTTERTLDRVLSQGNTVYLRLELPGMHTSIDVCFPTWGFTRIHWRHFRQEGIMVTEHDRRSDRRKKVPQDVSYRFGMRLAPWMFDGWIKRESGERIPRDVTANYAVLDQSFGHSGILIRVARKTDRAKEYLELYHIDDGNGYEFWDRWQAYSNTILLTRFIPVNPENPRLYWEPESRTKVEPIYTEAAAHS
ncbi:hypothetical protein KW785_00735 [Candidatus Parcubacteria bacterium]|nr:hypothetical protein [Candidatus Parcubacteria bacterium]